MIAHQRADVIEVVEHETELERMTGPQPAVEHRRGPGELVHTDITTVSKLRLSQANRRNAEGEIGDDGGVDIARRRRRNGLPIRGDGLLGVETQPFRQTPGAFFVDVVEDAGRHHEEAPLFRRRAHHELEAGAVSASHGVDRPLPEDRAVDHRLE